MSKYLFFALSTATCILANTAYAQVINDFAEYDTLMRRQYERMEQRGTPQFQQYPTGVQDTGLTLLGRWAWGPCQAVAAQGNYAYIGNGSTFQVLDLSNPTAPHVVGELVLNFVADIQVRGNLAYVCDGGSLLVLDISDPTTPTLISGIFLPLHSDRVRLADSVAFVLGPSGWLQAVDIADPSQLRLRAGKQATTLNFGNVAFTNSGRYVYVGGIVNCPCSITIIDGTNPDDLRLVGVLDPAYIHQSSATARDTLLLIGMPLPGYVEVYNIQNPTSPQLLSGLGGFANVGAIEIHDTIAFIAATGRVSAVSIANPSHPYILGSVSSGIGKLAFAQNRLHVAAWNSVYTLDVGRPDSMIVASDFRVGGWAVKVALKDTLAFVASDAAGLWILSITDPTHPRSVANVRPAGYADQVLLDSNYAYFSAYTLGQGGLGFWIVDISSPQQPEIVSYYLGIGSRVLAKMGNLIFAARWPKTYPASPDTILEIVDVSNVAAPQRVGVFQANYRPFDIAVKDSILYIASPDSGLRILDIHDPTTPNEIGRSTTSLATIRVRDTLAFGMLADFYVFNVSRLDSPYLMISTPAGYSISSPDLALSGNFAYWVDSNGGIVDISNPQQPRQVWSVTDYAGRQGVAVRGDTVYYAQSEGGISIWKNDIVTAIKESAQLIPSDYLLFQNYPNPFNDQTVIGFEIPRRDRIRIDVFNVLGQRVSTILDDVVERGHHGIPFTAHGLSTGIYFYRLQTAGRTITKPMIYIK